MKTIRLYLKNRTEAIALLLEKPMPDAPIFFRNLRVEIKKLYALFQLIQFFCPAFQQKKQFAAFKLFFRQAGLIRDLQIEEAMLTKYFSDTDLAAHSYRQHLHALLQKELEHFSLIWKETTVATPEESAAEIAPFIKKIKKKNLQSCMKQQQKDIEKLLFKKNIQTEILHLLRKKLKIYYYNRNMLELKPSKKFLSGKKVLPKLLGDWHDCEVAVLSLKKALKSGILSEKEAAVLQNIKKKIAADRASYLHKIKRTIPKI